MIVRPQSLQYTKRLYADEWAESNVFLKDTGRFSYTITPFFREPTRCASDLIHTCRVVIKTPAQVGKGFRLSQDIPTPCGYRKMGELSVGDYVYDSEGKPTKITSKSPIQKEPFYRFFFDDGVTIDATENHLWTFYLVNCEREVTWTSKEMYEYLQSHKIRRGRSPYRMPMLAHPIMGEETDLPIDPYTLGVWLGDGDTAGSMITENIEDFSEMQDWIAYPLGKLSKQKSKKCIRVNIKELYHKLRITGLLGNKHIPDVYKKAS